MRYQSKKCLVGDLVVSECLHFSLVGKLVVLRKFLVVSTIFNLATLSSAIALNEPTMNDLKVEKSEENFIAKQIWEVVGTQTRCQSPACSVGPYHGDSRTKFDGLIEM